MSYARRMARLSARIFGEVVRKTSPHDYRVVQMFARHPWQRDLPSWYPPIGKYDTILRRLRQLGLYGDGHLDFKETMDAQRRARGKGPPAKGYGKRAKGKKGK